MSEVIRIGLVSEGITDYVVIHAAVRSILGDRAYDLKLLQPESSAFHAGHFGGGWKGVSGWCGLVCQRNGGLAADIVLDTYDMLILHLDADVADENEPSKTSVVSQQAGAMSTVLVTPGNSSSGERMILATGVS